MAKDYTVSLEGKDNLSGTIKNIKKELKDTGEASEEINKIQQRFEKVEKSTAPVKKRLRELTELLVKLNIEGKSGTKLYNDIAAAAGSISDAVGDARESISKFASDTSGLDAGIELMRDFAAVTAIAQGSMALFGSENEEVEKVLKKTQGALALLNGAQQLQASLNAKGILQQKIKAVWESVSLANTKSQTTALGVNSSAKGVNTVATVANTAATQAMNVATAISKALFGDISGLILVGAGALLAYSIATDDSSNKTKNNNAQIDSAKNKFDEYAKSVASSASSMVKSYKSLQTEWVKLRTTQQKQEFITENAKSFNDLGFTIKSVKDAEDVLINNSDKMLHAFQLRAQAMALANIEAQAYEEYFKHMLNAENGLQQHVKAGDVVSGNSHNVRNGEQVGRDGQWHYTVEGAAKANKKIDAANKELLQKAEKEAKAKIDSTTSYARSKMVAINGELASLGMSSGSGSTKGKSGSGSSNTTKQNKEQRELTGLIEKQEDVIAKLNEQKKQATSVTEIENLNHQLEIETKRLNDLKDAGLAASKAAEELAKNQAKFDTQLSSIMAGKPDTSHSDGLFISKGAQASETRRASMSDNSSKQNDLSKLIASAGKGVDTSEAQNQLAALREQYNQLSLAEQQYTQAQYVQEHLSAMSGAIGNAVDQWNGLIVAMQNGATASQSGAEALVVLGNQLMQLGDQGAVAKIGAVMAAIGQIVLGFAQAAASPAVTSTGWGWLVFLGAGLAAMATTISTIQSFSEGGIINGASTHGDQLLARVNAGEMILNGSQQKKLFDILDSGGAVGGQNVTVTGKIQGSDIYLSQKNYTKVKSKVGLKI